MTNPLPSGLWGVLATPFHGPDLKVDLASLRREVDLYLGVPADGLVVLGVFGEGVALDSTEQATVVETVAERAGSTPVVVGVSARTTAVAVEQGRTAVAAAGEHLAGLMVQANTADPEVLAAHLQIVHATTGADIVLQDYPVASGVQIGTEAILRVLDRCPFVVAVKSEAPPTSAAIGRLTARTDVPVFGGLGGVGLLDELAAGAAGAMTGFSHPEGLRMALDAWADGGFPAARRAFAPWLPLVNFEAQPGVGLSLRKEILRRRGVFSDAAVRPPSPQAPETILHLLAHHLSTLTFTPDRMA
ncbi:MAG: dihydrodipicolinate synthase family protein [Nocardioides sp.]|nr:dihydrodipicolinate synthase family protein [Nocardioides sp.]